MKPLPTHKCLLTLHIQYTPTATLTQRSTKLFTELYTRTTQFASLHNVNYLAEYTTIQLRVRWSVVADKTESTSSRRVCARYTATLNTRALAAPRHQSHNEEMKLFSKAGLREREDARSSVARSWGYPCDANSRSEAAPYKSSMPVTKAG